MPRPFAESATLATTDARANREHRQFGGGTGLFTDQTRDEIARKSGAQGLQEPGRAGLADREMGGARDAVEHMEVIGEDAGLEQALTQVRERARIVVDAGQQDRLVQERHAGLAQSPAGPRDRLVDLAGMIHVQDHDDRKRGPAEPVEERLVDAVWDHDRHAGMEPQTLHVRQFLQGAYQVGELVVAQGQGIAAAQDHLADRPVGGEMGDRRPPPIPRGVGLRIRKVPAEAIPAVDRAGAGGGQKRPAFVFVKHAGHGLGGEIPDRVPGVAGFDGLLQVERQNLAQQGVMRVARGDTREIGARHAQREEAVDPARGRKQLFGQIEGPQQLLGVADGGGEVGPPGRLPRWESSMYHRRALSVFGPQKARDADQTPPQSEIAMTTYSTNEFKNGLKIMLDADPCSIIENEFVKPGKGQAFNRVRIRNLKTGRVVERTFKSGDTVEGADVVDVEMQYLYSDGEFWYFMSPETYEQLGADKTAVGDSAKWLKEQALCLVTLWNGVPLSVEPPVHVILKVTETDPGLRGDTSGGGGKPATLETGAVVRVPLFINVGDSLKVNTQTGEYIARAKE